MVNLHKVLIDYASSTNIKVSCLRVSHLSVGKPHVLTRSLQLGVRIIGCQIVDVWRGGVINNVTLALIADAPSVENDQECLLGLTIIISGRIIGNS